jgi:two-component system, NarL family, response regulator DevR
MPERDGVMPAAAGRPIRVFVLDDPRDCAPRPSGPARVRTGHRGRRRERVRRAIHPLLTTLRPDVAILDARLLDGNGIEVCRSVRSIDGRIRCIILTTYDDDDDALLAAIMAGASGYVLKQVRGTDLVGSIRRVAAGESLLDRAVAARVLERLRSSAKRVGNLGLLRNREYEVPCLVADGASTPLRKPSKPFSSILVELGLERRTQAGERADCTRTERTEGLPKQASGDARLLDAEMAIASHLDLSEMLYVIVRYACQLAGAANAALGVLGRPHLRTSMELSEFHHTGIAPESAHAIGHLPRGYGVLGALIENPQPLRRAELSDHPQLGGPAPHHPPCIPSSAYRFACKIKSSQPLSPRESWRRAVL